MQNQTSEMNDRQAGVFYAITAQFLTVQLDAKGVAQGFGSRQIPTFYLHEGVQGITDAEHAKEIALSILDPASRYGAARFSIDAARCLP